MIAKLLELRFVLASANRALSLWSVDTTLLAVFVPLDGLCINCSEAM